MMLAFHEGMCGGMRDSSATSEGGAGLAGTTVVAAAAVAEVAEGGMASKVLDGAAEVGVVVSFSCVNFVRE